ncbi:hypothetical protein ASPWEDRAFT_110735 [Aspergillus wentii DTO 134E9]|uniref:RNI-like protein n=1 Tax=Aspergillus wentii DTO 134E9 TaxID=1073089 RepID=A0A1L9RLG1_ASPWE|nr:uncharacterized protein ASPWEDRAFT_110735 [Aspergillus wentii DTO 134E9]OJJ35723.1 hypothetical protein ASPWEDRAFT_110735 [Aspergillus wentii DTO 134E9]
MASAATITPQVISLHEHSIENTDLMDEAAKWATVIRSNLTKLQNDEEILAVPCSVRSRTRPTTLAPLIASLIYPAPVGSFAQVVNYERDVATLKEALRLQKRHHEGSMHHKNPSEKGRRPRWSDRILAQGPWDQIATAEMLKGVRSLPMPVDISNAESLSPFFNHLRLGGSNEVVSDTAGNGQETVEPYYNLPMLEFEKGVLFADRRMDLCKMALGPPNVSTLMQSLRNNTFVQHFLLGNNIIGPTGARAIADFILEFPCRIDTWYLAGNCIDSHSFSLIADALVKSTAVTNLWLKRNPLGPGSTDSIFRLIANTPNLRTLDLDQTELGDAGVVALFNKLATYSPSIPLSLKAIYLSGVGISIAACEAMASYLASPHCGLTSLYMSNNPIGDAGARALAAGLQHNRSIQRLCLQSIGLTGTGARVLISSLHNHPTIQTLDIGQSYSTEDLGVRFNYLASVDTITALTVLLTTSSAPLTYLNLGPQPIDTTTAIPLVSAALQSKSILHLSLKPLIPSERPKEDIQYQRLTKALFSHNLSNIRTHYNNPNMTYKEWDDDLKRWCVSDETSVRKIDSVYRNRAAQKARKGEEVLNKWLDEKDKAIVEEVMYGKW